jgi:hypothetical protein
VRLHTQLNALAVHLRGSGTDHFSRCFDNVDSKELPDFQGDSERVGVRLLYRGE